MKNKEVIKVRVLPDGPAEGEYYRRPVAAAKTNSIAKGDWFTKADYNRLGKAIENKIDTIISCESYADGIKEILKIVEKLPKHISKPVINKLEQVNSQEKLTTLVYRIILRYTL